MKTKSGQQYQVFFSNELMSALKSIAIPDSKGVSWHVRQACIEYLEARGVDVSNLYNPEGRGVRSDLRKKKLTHTQIEAAIKPPPPVQSQVNAKTA